MQIRPLRKEELGTLAETFVRSYQEGWTPDLARRYLEKFYDFEPASCLVAVEGDKLVGSVLGYSYPKPGGLVLFIQELFVEPDFRHLGFGKALVTALRNSFAEHPKVKVTPLVKADTRVLNFYNSLGFETNHAITFFDMNE